MQKYLTQKVITAVLLVSLIGPCYVSGAPAGENTVPVAPVGWVEGNEHIKTLVSLINQDKSRAPGQSKKRKAQPVQERRFARPSKQQRAAESVTPNASESSVSMSPAMHFACTKCEMKYTSEQEMRDHARAKHRYRSKSSTQYWKRVAPLPLPMPQAEVPVRQEAVSEQTNQQIIDCLFCQKRIINSTRVQHVKTECSHLVPCLMRAVQNDHPELFPLLMQGLQQDLRGLYPA